MYSRHHPRHSLAGAALMALACLAPAAAVQADELQVPVGAQGQFGVIPELRGLKQHQVSAQLGEPVGIQGPVGEPAISRWEYADFFVYFERDLVLHTVSKHES